MNPSPTLRPAAVCDLAPTALIAFAGPDAAAFLQGQLSNDAVALRDGAAQYTSYNSPKGRVLANLVLWQRATAATSVLSLKRGTAPSRD